MKVIIQRVTNAKVIINGEVVSSIGQGVCAFIGISKHDTEREMHYIADKILTIRLFEDDKGKNWCRNIVASKFEVLCVSQVTLYNTWKGNKPNFDNAMPPSEAKKLYEAFVQHMKNKYDPEKVKDGQFGAYMQVALENDGPVTFEIESPVNPSLCSKLFQSDSFDLLNISQKEGQSSK